ncbi:MAG: hypothetical protein EBU28_01320 [Gammaproteobacteria bacterium]|nr:hypothetical protein [Gammaproteobacteria bacterium]
MRIDVVTIFPQMFATVREYGMTRIAVEQGALAMHLWDPRSYSEDSYKRVDDRPYGGGPGMVMQAPQMVKAIRAAREASRGKVICLSPQGPVLNYSRLRELSEEPALVLLDWPHFTRPEVFEGERVPEVLLGGNHEEIRRWRLKEALGQTWLKRPDLLECRNMSDEEQMLLAEFKAEHP